MKAVWGLMCGKVFYNNDSRQRKKKDFKIMIAIRNFIDSKQTNCLVFVS
jgi:hypothetical protein